jgi:hypothetical protein
MKKLISTQSFRNAIVATIYVANVINFVIYMANH